MGTLQIRQASEGVRSLGSVRMPELDTGASSFFAAQANAAEKAANAAATAGRAAIAGISERGRIVAGTLKNLGGLALEFADRENRRVATNAILEKRKERNLYMYGDGTDANPGQFNAQIDDAAKWISGLKEENDRMDEKWTKDLNGAQRRIYMDAMAEDEVGWQLKIGSHAARATLKAETDTAVAATAFAKDEAVKGFPVEAFRDASLDKYFAAKEHEMEVRGVPESMRGYERKAAAEDFVTSLAKETFSRWEGTCSQMQNPDDVRKFWETEGAKLKSLDGEVPTNARLRAALGSSVIDEAHRALFEKRFVEARDRSVANAMSRKAENDRQVRDGLVAKEAALFKGKDGKSATIPNPENPEEVKADMMMKANQYSDLANEAEEAGNYQLALAYRKTSQTLQKGLYGYMSDLDKAQRQSAYDRTRAEFDLGGYMDENGDFREESVWERQDRAQKMFNEGRLTYTQYATLMSKTKPEVNEDFTWLRAQVLDYAKKIVPAALRYNAKRQTFEVNPTKDVRGSTETGVEWKVYGDEQMATYANFATALNDTAAWMKQNKKSREDGWEYFLRLTDGDARDASQRSIDAKLNFERQVNDDYMKARKVNAK
jgi:hypothetical protein